MILLTTVLALLTVIVLINTLRQRSKQLPKSLTTPVSLDAARCAKTLSDTNSDDFRTLRKTIGEVFPDVIVAPGLTTGSTDTPHYERITDNTFRFIPMRLTSEDLERIHGPNERISVKNYLEIIRFFIQQIRNSAS